jgi:hypothetical protein
MPFLGKHDVFRFSFVTTVLKKPLVRMPGRIQQNTWIRMQHNLWIRIRNQLNALVPDPNFLVSLNPKNLQEGWGVARSPHLDRKRISSPIYSNCGYY